MAVLAALSIPNTDESPDSAPWRIVAELPSVELDVVQFERDGMVAVPYFWMRGVPTGTFESVLSAEPQMTSVRRLERTEDAALYKLRWEVDWTARWSAAWPTPVASSCRRGARQPSGS